MTRRQIAKETIAVTNRGQYEVDGETISIAEAQATAIANGQLYSPERLNELRQNLEHGPPQNVIVTDATTQQAAQNVSNRSAVTLLNFASARNVGGGFLNGSKAQEEDLCRCSGLYAAILPFDTYYQVNRAQSSLLYTDYAIYSPRVPFFKVRGTGKFLAEPFFPSVITAPAPNTGPHLRKNPEGHAEIETTFARRWRNVLAIARDQQTETLILGAWGCGAFGGDPEVSAATAREALAELGTNLEQVIFAIPGKGKQSRRNLEVFRSVFNAC